MSGRIISGATRICGIIGDPVDHSISPQMHNAIFKELDLNYIYVPFRVREADLEKAVASIRALNIQGINVTLPHKVNIMKYLDEIDSIAEGIGAVNVVDNKNGILKGYNTDATGFLKALKEQGIKVDGKNIVILGAGGAAKAISFIMTKEHAYLTILNRSLDKARDCAHGLLRFFGKEPRILAFNQDNLRMVVEEANILINTTNVGMSPKYNDSLVSGDLIKKHMIVIDIVYNPVKTRLLKEAEQNGARTINGIEMLVWQGAEAFEIWTGKKAPVDTMRQIAYRVLTNED